MRVSIYVCVCSFWALIQSGCVAEIESYDPDGGVSDAADIDVRSQAITGGQIAQGDGPSASVVALMLENTFKNNIASCGGTLIAPRWVLTTSFCETQSEFVIAGRRNLADTGGEIIPIRQKFHFPSPSNEALALLWLKSASRQPTVEVATEADMALTTEGTLTTALGWGHTWSTGRQNLLYQVDLPLVSFERCRTWYLRRQTLALPADAMCAGLEPIGRGACPGDNGGPLLISTPRGRVVAGVLHYNFYSDRCGEPQVPTMATRVAPYADWIKRTMQDTPNACRDACLNADPGCYDWNNACWCAKTEAACIRECGLAAPEPRCKVPSPYYPR